MFIKAMRAVKVGFFGLTLALVLVAGSNAQTGRAADPDPVRIEMTAIRSGDTVTYNITLVNSTSSNIGSVFVAGAVPQGETFVKAVAAPAGSWFRGYEGSGSKLQAAVWLGESIPANGRLGPFTYQVKAGTTLPSTYA